MECSKCSAPMVLVSRTISKHWRFPDSQIVKWECGCGNIVELVEFVNESEVEE